MERMAMHFPDLDDEVRVAMLAEIHLDQEEDGLYEGKRLTERGRDDWPYLLTHAAESGTPQSLAAELRKNNRSVAVPCNAPEVLAEGEFNRFYIRAVCVIALSRGQADVQVYRAKGVTNPRPGSSSKIGSRVDAGALLNDLRTSIGVESALRVPGGPNSGLSVRLLPIATPALAT
jgi:hypothetical protein